MEKKVKVLSGFRLTIPDEARQQLMIKVGEELEFRMEGNRLVYKAGDLPDDPVFTMLGLATGERRKLDEFEEAVVEEIHEKLERT